MDLAGKVALVTGASRGVGAATAVALAEAGAAVATLSSAVARCPSPGLMAYGMSKIALERMTVDAARQLAGDGIAVNCFRIDVPVYSEGFAANAPDLDQSDWEPTEVAAEGILWVLRQPVGFSGELLSMYALRKTRGIMASRAKRPFTGVPPQALQSGLVEEGETVYREPY